jgi:hypothetical protein
MLKGYSGFLEQPQAYSGWNYSWGSEPKQGKDTKDKAVFW